jgi:undecaprenyl pyrophosphate phosphatase UppP
MIFRSHLVSMIIYAALVSVVLGVIRKEDAKSRFRYGLTLFLIMIVGAIVFGWFMYLFAR